jgi:murein DD-endopeptidase MepM/ murein hydrolase activator NlpD
MMKSSPLPGPVALACSLILILLTVNGCKQEIIPEAFLPRTAHEAYVHSLEQANLHLTALGRDWIHAGRKALVDAVEVPLPFEEAFIWDPGKAEAAGYRFLVKRGVRVEVAITVFSSDSLLLFADLFRERADTVIHRIHVATADDQGHRLEFEPRRDAYYDLRVQPELLRGGRFRILIREVPSLGFPVEGKNSRSIGSFFGDPRDGGRREHHGVDIFAPRNTPVLAPSNSTVSRVGVGDIGGRYVWLYDAERSIHLYFAHLETQEVERGDQVRAGQLIGTVGNSGNARYTPPHLHFGIYSRGPINPYYFIAETDTIPQSIRGDTLLLGRMARTVNLALMISSPAHVATISDTLERDTLITVTALTGTLARVQLPDGLSGYMPVRQIEPVVDTLMQMHAPGALP